VLYQISASDTDISVCLLIRALPFKYVQFGPPCTLKGGKEERTIVNQCFRQGWTEISFDMCQFSEMAHNRYQLSLIDIM